MDGFKGQDIQVRALSLGELDAFGNPTKSYGDLLDVSDVLIAPGDATANIEDGHPFGADVSYTLYVPKGAFSEWANALVLIDGEEYSVIGDPKPYPENLMPLGRNLVVKVVKHEGY